MEIICSRFNFDGIAIRNASLSSSDQLHAFWFDFQPDKFTKSLSHILDVEQSLTKMFYDGRLHRPLNCDQISLWGHFVYSLRQQTVGTEPCACGNVFLLYLLTSQSAIYSPLPISGPKTTTTTTMEERQIITQQAVNIKILRIWPLRLIWSSQYYVWSHGI